ncbi:MAG: SHOCT domain-containing protein [Streptosporangiaceae bacterium]
MNGMMPGMMGGVGLWMLLWALVGVALVVLAVVGAVSAVRALRRGDRTPDRRALPDNEPREILRRRYAAGDIDEDEYLQKLSGLSQI